jgi:hypothetical protein
MNLARLECHAFVKRAWTRRGFDKNGLCFQSVQTRGDLSTSILVLWIICSVDNLYGIHKVLPKLLGQLLRVLIVGTNPGAQQMRWGKV